tara:strand:+ start:8829 stop:9386 length:558 start_codon:yes stop_codon:yes gene_type:complete
MTEEERKTIFRDFLNNGMNIEPFKFLSDYDKQNFFTMFEEYLKAMTHKEVEVKYDDTNDIIIFIDDRFICGFYILEEYTVLKADTDLFVDDEDLVLCLTMLFLTVKELTNMIRELSKVFSKAASKNKEEKYTKSNSKQKFVPTSKLPSNIMNNIEKIKDLQKSIFAENEKYKVSRKRKDDSNDDT